LSILIGMQSPKNLLQLIEKYQAGTATPEEKQVLHDWYHSFDDEQAEIFSEDLREEFLEQHLLERLRASVKEEKPRGILSLLKRWQVAALLLLVPATIFVILTNKPAAPDAEAVAETRPVQQEILPGGDRALLILPDGKSIELDSLGNGLVVQEGNTSVEKAANGLLLYRASQEESGSDNTVEYHTISTPRGGQYKVTLSDGTKVWLNAASTLRFPVKFTGAERHVEVTGETYFEVAHNPQLPFIVHAPGTDVQVLGTHFNLNAYNDEEDIRTTLIKGSVNVKATSVNQSGQLLPGQQSRITPDGKLRIHDNADVEEAIAWINGRFQFRSAGLKTILRQIARWYDVDVEYRGNVDMRFSGQLARSEQVYNVLEKLKLTGEVNFVIEGRKIIVTR